ncbi:MAG TPA: gas vesicle protein GvpJ [Vicinamibacterales bacterium]|nr:gas vesicle protein GvpJ [Vicinamibacterales bacterium]
MPRGRPPKRGASPLPPPRVSAPAPPARQVARIIDESDSSLLDVLDNLLNRGVVLNADLILALADVDLVYVRLSALLCAADRVLPDATQE